MRPDVPEWHCISERDLPSRRRRFVTAREAASALGWPGERVLRTCGLCARAFQPVDPHQRFCNRLLSSDQRLIGFKGGDAWADQPYLSR